MKITKDAILSTLPVVLAEDREMRALADPIAEALAARVPEIDLIRLFSRIDELPEDLLDILAYDFKADWWEYDATLEEKRAVFKKIWYVHRHKGTKASVETAIGALFQGAAVSEWFEYGGEPYHFRMNVPIREEQVRSSADGYKDRVFFLVNYFKNLRSVLESISFSYETEISGELSISSHLGRGLMITPIAETIPDMTADLELFLSGAMPRWESTRILNDLTPEGLVAHPEGTKIFLYAWLAILGYHDLSAWGDPETKALHIENEGLTAEGEGTALVLVGG